MPTSPSIHISIVVGLDVTGSIVICVNLKRGARHAGSTKRCTCRLSKGISRDSTPQRKTSVQPSLAGRKLRACEDAHLSRQRNLIENEPRSAALRTTNCTSLTNCEAHGANMLISPTPRKHEHLEHLGTAYCWPRTCGSLSTKIPREDEHLRLSN